MVEEGTALLSGSGSLGNNCAIDLANGALLSVAAVTGGENFNGSTFAVRNGQHLAGDGTVDGAMAIESGGIIAPSDGTGQLTLSHTTFGSQGCYIFEVDNALGMAGSVSEGWDLIDCSGTLDVAATSKSPFQIEIRSLTSEQLAGPAVPLTQISVQKNR